MSIEVPRLVKKPGPPIEYKRVENHEDLDKALADGWLLRLPSSEPAAAVPEASAAPTEDASVGPDIADLTANELSTMADGILAEPDEEPEAEEPKKRGPGRPRKER